MIFYPVTFLFLILFYQTDAEKKSRSITVDLRLPLAGGLAGGISNALLYPIDTIKTMQQSDKSIKGFKSAILKLYNNDGGIFKLYSGFWAAVIGSVPSSAIYFGSYETSKKFLFDRYQHKISRPAIHMLAAASGNIMSSFIFVPKDAIKQQMQAIKTGSIPWVRLSPFYTRPSARIDSTVSLLEVMKKMAKSKGIRGFYPNYRATLMRNIPSAVIRFTVYEELRLLVKGNKWTNANNQTMSIGYALAGGFASAFSSILTTPFDVVKTRLATGLLSPGTPVFTAMNQIMVAEGVRGLFAGAQARVLMSALFGGVGFASFEACKKKLGVESFVLKQGDTKESSVITGDLSTSTGIQLKGIQIK
mmetsp:Transcript_1409/g.1547  ORF Transcript_1409/g.1547 Transcript_1409/m.1547 type:complete len:361 (-) Transcript_1409:14-1096(-)